jgi:hypothetical protein
MAEHPPVWQHPNKLAVAAISCPPGSIHRGVIHYSRWAAMELPAEIHARGAARRVDGRNGFYDYAPISGAERGSEWHVNFADPHLFVAYGSPLLAQDEMQVAEHPALGALSEALAARGRQAVTSHLGRPSPILVTGVERRCRIATDPDPGRRRPRGLYGNEFAAADPEAVRSATTAIDPPTITNLVAMAAPAYGEGRYTSQQVERILTTAFTGFRAAALESARQLGDGPPVFVHTGFWGCGAFGGNRVLMAILQTLAVEMAGIEHLLFHTGGAGGEAPLRSAIQTIEGKLAATPLMETRALIARVADLGFNWGVSDGN